MEKAQTQHRGRMSYTAPGFRKARTIDDLRTIARRRLPPFMFEYLVGGADGERTLQRNADLLESWLWLPKMSVDISRVELATKLFGEELKLPIIIAPTGFNGMIWRHGDLALAKAASEAGIPMVQSTVSMSAVSDLANVPGLSHWFQLYAYGGLAVAEQVMARANSAGCTVLMVTVDGATAGNRLWDQRSYAAPGRLTLRSRMECLLHPSWLWSVILRDGPPNFLNLLDFIEDGGADVYRAGRWIASNRPALTWDDIARIRHLWPGKLVLKGILRVDEAMRAVAVGADGIVLSNHGGRQVDPTIAPIEVLAPVRRAVGPDFTLLIDSGYRTGSQIAVALALGADAVLTGRATLFGLAAAGQQGAARAIAILKSELSRTMALVGAQSIKEVSADLLVQHLPGTAV